MNPRNIWSGFEAGRGLTSYALRKKKKMMMVTIITIVTV